MQVRDALSRLLPGVHNDAKSVFHHRRFLSQLLDHQHDMSDQFLILVVERGDRRNVLFRYDQYVDRRDGIDVPESYDLVIFIYENFPAPSRPGLIE